MYIIICIYGCYNFRSRLIRDPTEALREHPVEKKLTLPSQVELYVRT